MNSPLPRLPAALTAAVQRIKVTAREAAQRCVDALGVAVLNSVSNSEREHLLAAQFDLSRKLSMFATTFNERLDDSLAADFRRREGSPRTSTGGSSWQSLTLVDDREVEIQVSADRFALTLEHDCEWELRELDALMIGLLHSPHAGRDAGEVRNPLRPEVIGKAMVAACDAICDRAPVRKVMAEHISRVLASAMAALYSHHRRRDEGRRHQGTRSVGAHGAGPWQRAGPVHQHRLRHARQVDLRQRRCSILAAATCRPAPAWAPAVAARRPGTAAARSVRSTARS